MTDPYSEYTARTPYGGLYGVIQDDIVQGCADYFLHDSTLLQMVGIEPGTQIPFIFQNTLFKTMDGTQSNAIVVSYSGDWSAPGRSGFDAVRLSVEIFCDPLRDVDGNAGVGDPEPRLRLNSIYRAVDKIMNRPMGEVWMGDVLTTDHTRLGSMFETRVGDADGTIRGQIFYGVVLIGCR